MPSEVSIAKPLSGPECIEACVHALRAALARDDRFSTHIAYSGFHATLDFKFRPSMSFVPDVERKVEIVEGEQDELEPTPTVTEHIELPVRPPNQVRAEAEMPQPVLVTDEKGNSREEWRKTSAKPPKQNKVKGAA